MNTSKRQVALAGWLYIAGTVAGILSLIFAGPIVDSADPLAASAANNMQLILGALFVLAMGLSLALIPVVLYPTLKQYSLTLALGYLVVRGALETFGYFADLNNWLSLSNLGKTVALRGGAENLRPFAEMLAHTNVVSTTGSLVFILGALMFYGLLYHTRLVPRWLSGWGLLAAIPYVAVSLLVMLGMVKPLSLEGTLPLMPLALQEMVLAVWMIVKGFDTKTNPPSWQARK